MNKQTKNKFKARIWKLLQTERTHNMDAVSAIIDEIMEEEVGLNSVKDFVIEFIPKTSSEVSVIRKGLLSIHVGTVYGVSTEQQAIEEVKNWIEGTR